MCVCARARVCAGHLDPTMLLGMLGTLEAGLHALGIPHSNGAGSGALAAAAAVIAAAGGTSSRYTPSSARSKI